MMTAMNIRRALISVAALLFAGIAVAFWVAPEQAARGFGLEATGAAGSASLRADLGGLFAGLAIFCAAAAWTRVRAWYGAAAFMLAAIVTGRAISWIANGGPAGDIGSLALELIVLAVLLWALRATVTRTGDQRRPRRRAAIVATALVATVLSGLAAMSRPEAARALYDRGAQRLAAVTNNAILADDALRVAICGSSAPLASAARAKACVAVFAGGKFYVVDVGPESVENLVLWGMPLSSVGGVLLTHFHSDHIGDLGELNLQTWAGGRPAPMTVYGGPGVERIVAGFNDAYRIDQGYRTAHHTDAVMPAATWPMVARTVELSGEATPAKNRTGLVLDDGALRITAIEVDHAPITPAYAYRFDYKGRSVLVTGDLKMHEPLAVSARGVDVMVSEAISYTMTRSLGAGAKSGGRDRAAKIMHDIEDYHIKPEQAAQIANEAGVKLLVFYHLLPAPDGWLPRRVFEQGISQARNGDWTIADDGSLYTLPIGSTGIQRGRVIED
jgi:ribonuclease Z